MISAGQSPNEYIALHWISQLVDSDERANAGDIIVASPKQVETTNALRITYSAACFIICSISRSARRYSTGITLTNFGR